MWSSLDCFLCCKKFVTKTNDQKKSLLIRKDAKRSGSGVREDVLSQGRTPVYNVRRVSRIAGTISLEDVRGSNPSIHSTKSKHEDVKIKLERCEETKKDSGLWECPSDSSLCTETTQSTKELAPKPASSPPQAKQKAAATDKHSAKQWAQKALKPLHLHHDKGRNKLLAPGSPTMAVSSPNLHALPDDHSLRTPDLSAERRSGSQRRSAVFLDVNDAPNSPWLKSQSLLDVSNATNAAARDHGINPALYPESPPQHDNCEPAKSKARSKDDPYIELPHGTVLIAAGYTAGMLHVHVHKVEQLALKGEKNKYPVSLKLSVLTTDKQVATKSSAATKDWADPCKFGEDFEFAVEEVEGRTLRISVCDAGITSSHSKYDSMGHALLSLQHAGLESKPHTFKLKLFKQSEPCHGNKGFLHATLSYDQREQKITLLVLQSRELYLATSSKAPDKYTTYVKASLYCKGQKKNSKKSNIITNEKSPFYNHEFNFRNMRIEQMGEMCLVVSVLAKRHLKSDGLLGRVHFGPNFYADGATLTPWGRVMLSQQTATHWYTLRI